MTTNGATMLGGLTHLFASNPALFLIIPALVLILGVVLRTRHRLTTAELGYNIKRATVRWQDTLTKVQDQKVLTQPDVINHSPAEYDGPDRTKYEDALKVWATWHSQRQALQQRVAEAGKLETDIQAATWWKFPLGKLKKSTRALLDGVVQFSVGAEAPSEVTVAEFLPKLLASADQSRDLADIFASAFARAADSVSSLNRAVDGTGSRDSGLLGQKNKLLALELPIEPYKADLDAIIETRGKLTVTVQRQPLTNYEYSVNDLLGRIAKLQKDMAFAGSMHVTGLSTALMLEQLKARVDELRRLAVPSQLPGVDIQGCWSLDEEGFAPEPTIDQAVQYSAEFKLALKSGKIGSLEKLDRSVREAIAQTSRLIESTMAEKTCFEQRFSEITADCTEVDLAADAQTRQGCLASYAAQKWAQARLACEAYSSAHKKRLAARDECKKLRARMAEVTALVGANVDVSSAGCDEEFGRLVQTIGALKDEAKQGAADWDALATRIAGVNESTAAGGVEAFVSRLNSEIDAHGQAMALVEKLQSDLRYTDEKTRAKWGGASARTDLESVAAALETTLASALPKKQDWKALTERVREALALLSPALQAVQEEVRRDRLEYDRLATLSADIEFCNAASYTRTICGRVYGQGIYCPTVIPTQKLAAAQAHYQNRRYDDMAAALTAGRQVLIYMHLDAWWLCLQTLAFSPDSCARQFAQAEGYNSSGYDEWMEVHKKRSMQGALFNISEIICDKHQGQSLAEEVTGDAPVISDYTPGALVSR